MQNPPLLFPSGADPSFLSDLVLSSYSIINCCLLLLRFVVDYILMSESPHSSFTEVKDRMRGEVLSSMAMEEDILSNLTSASGEHAASASSARNDNIGGCNNQGTATKKKRGLPCNPDPDAEVIALSPRSLMGTNKFICEVCNKGFRRDQNLQLHRRGHNLPWKLKQRRKDEIIRRKVYVCPEPACAHHDPSRALGDLTGIKKHYFRKHGEKRWKCDRCEKRYAVQSDWKAHSKICGTREYKCDCGTIFSRRDSFITHRAFCDALTQETMMKSFPPPPPPMTTSLSDAAAFFSPPPSTNTPSSSGVFPQLPHFNLPNHFLDNSHGFQPLVKPEPEQYRLPATAVFGQQPQQHAFCFPSPSHNPSASATALLQKATMMGITSVSDGGPLASRCQAAHNSIDLLQDMNKNMTAMMMMSSISPEVGQGFDGGGSIHGILDPEGGVGGGGKGATRDFLSLNRRFPQPPPRNDNLIGLHGNDFGMLMQGEERDNVSDSDDHQGLWHG